MSPTRVARAAAANEDGSIGSDDRNEMKRNETKRIETKYLPRPPRPSPPSEASGYHIELPGVPALHSELRAVKFLNVSHVACIDALSTKIELKVMYCMRSNTITKTYDEFLDLHAELEDEVLSIPGFPTFNLAVRIVSPHAVGEALAAYATRMHHRCERASEHLIRPCRYPRLPPSHPTCIAHLYDKDTSNEMKFLTLPNFNTRIHPACIAAWRSEASSVRGSCTSSRSTSCACTSRRS